MNSLTGYYTFHGLVIAISGDPTVLAALQSRFRQFPTNGHAHPDVTFKFHSIPDREHHVVERPSGRARPVYESPAGEVAYFDTADQLYLNYTDRVRVLCDPKHAHARVSVLQPGADNLWLASHPLFTIPFIELLKRRGCYSLHAAGLSVNGRGLLLAGTTGAGKSTLAVALLRAGFGFLGDDMVFLSSGQEGLRVLAFPDEIDVTDETARLFPELHNLLDLPKSQPRAKRQICAQAVYGVEPIHESRPAALIFPQVAHTEKSVLKPMKRDEALLELVPNVLLTEARSAQSHLDALGELVGETECYRLETGRNFAALPLLLREVLG